MYIYKLGDTVDKYNNIYYRTIKMRPTGVSSSKYFDFEVESNDKDPKFKVGDHVRKCKYKNIFPKGYTPIGQRKFL